MVLSRMYAALVDLVKVLFPMVVFLGQRCWVMNVSLKSDHTNHEERQKLLNSTDLLSHNNVGFSIFKIDKGVKVPVFLSFSIFYGCQLLSCKEDDYFAVPVFFVTRVLLFVVIPEIDRFAHHSLRA